MKVTIPNEYLACDNLPEVPTPQKQSEAGIYILRLHEVAKDCKNTVDKIKEYIDKNK